MWNKFLEIHANKRPEQVIGQSVFSIFPELPKRWFERKINSVVQLHTPSFCSWEQRHHLFELPHTRPITTGSEFMAQNCTFFPISDEDNVIDHISILIEDMTDVWIVDITFKEFEVKNQATVDKVKKVAWNHGWPT